MENGHPCRNVVESLRGGEPIAADEYTNEVYVFGHDAVVFGHLLYADFRVRFGAEGGDNIDQILLEVEKLTRLRTFTMKTIFLSDRSEVCAAGERNGIDLTVAVYPQLPFAGLDQLTAGPLLGRRER